MQSSGPAHMLQESQKEEREKRAKRLFEEATVENFLNSIKDTEINIQKPQGIEIE